MGCSCVRTESGRAIPGVVAGRGEKSVRTDFCVLFVASVSLFVSWKLIIWIALTMCFDRHTKYGYSGLAFLVVLYDIGFLKKLPSLRKVKI